MRRGNMHGWLSLGSLGSYYRAVAIKGICCAVTSTGGKKVSSAKQEKIHCCPLVTALGRDTFRDAPFHVLHAAPDQPPPAQPAPPPCKGASGISALSALDTAKQFENVFREGRGFCKTRNKD